MIDAARQDNGDEEHRQESTRQRLCVVTQKAASTKVLFSRACKAFTPPRTICDWCGNAAVDQVWQCWLAQGACMENYLPSTHVTCSFANASHRGEAEVRVRSQSTPTSQAVSWPIGYSWKPTSRHPHSNLQCVSERKSCLATHLSLVHKLNQGSSSVGT